MVAKENRSGFPNMFQRESLKLVNNLISLSGSAFYLVGTDMRHRGVVAQDLDPLVERDYYKNFRALDPLNPVKFENTEDTVVTIDSQMSELKLLQTIYYQDFMKPNNHRYVADMFFRSHGRICAVLTMLRDEKGGSSTFRVGFPIILNLIEVIYSAGSSRESERNPHVRAGLTSPVEIA